MSSARTLVALVTLGAALGAQTAPTLFPQQKYDVGPEGTSVLLADLDADGALDALVTRSSPAQLEVLAGLGDGRLGAPVVHGLAVDARSAATADLDGDGWLDVLVGGASQPGQLALLRSAGGGALQAPAYVASGHKPLDVALGDFTGDGRPDAVVACLASYGAALHVNLGGLGGMVLGGPGLFPLASSPSSVACGDFDADGNLDAALLHPAAAEITILLGNGHGALFNAGITGIGGTQPADLLVMDLDADGDPDLLTANTLSSNVSVLRGAPGAAFAAPQLAAVAGAPIALAPADVNDDGFADVAVAAKMARSVVLLAGSGDGGLAVAGTLRTGAGIAAVAAGDLDALGHDDFVALDPAAGHAVVSLSRGCGLPEAALTLDTVPLGSEVVVTDIDADGWPDLVALEQAQPTSPPTPPSLAVLNGSASGDFGAATPVALNLSSYPKSLHAADMNDDGVPDLVMCWQSGESIAVSYGLGDVSFAPPAPAWAGQAPIALEIADISLDGRLDVLVSSGNDFGLWYLRQKLNGAFAAASHVPMGTYSPASFAIGDLDEDGLDDVLGAGTYKGELIVVLANTPGTWAAAETIDLSVHPEDLALADVDGDGHLDALTADGDDRSVSVSAGDGGGGFLPPVAHPLPGDVPVIEVADVDADGALDVLACTTTDDSLIVLRGLGGGALGAPLAFGLGSGEGTRDLVVADLNLDGRLDAVIAHQPSSGVSLVVQNGGWLALPGSLGGGAGQPLLSVHGWPVAGAEVQLDVCHAAASSPAFVIAGLSELGAPFKGGLLVPAPDVVFGPVLGTPAGTLALDVAWPALPVGLPLWLQVWIADPAGPAGYSATNALRATSS